MKPVFNIYVISDTHFGHENVRVLANRPFETLEEMDKKIRENWNRTVREQDIVIVLGDMVWTKGSSEKMKQYLQELNGRIILVVGNHDNKSTSWYLANGLDFVCDRFVWEFNGKKILFLHDPENVSEEERNKYQYVIHGHRHQNGPFIKEINKCILVNVSVEQIKYIPLNLITLLSRLTQGFYASKNNL